MDKTKKPQMRIACKKHKWMNTRQGFDRKSVIVYLLRGNRDIYNAKTNF